ncbi:MAG: prepilin-type N-terminal cleavage/methylation domain-containing protein [Erysipelothrix sp.]|nr:prepilin-type N-terminal cleavage/methylation domain-containing protein [Erysipelothrix sp.]
MRKGFTMLEMIVVVLIVALLMLLTIPNIQKVMGIVQKRGCESQLKIVDAAILQYMLEYEQIPDSTQTLISSGLLSDNQAKCQNNKVIAIVDGQAVEQ